MFHYFQTFPSPFFSTIVMKERVNILYGQLRIFTCFARSCSNCLFQHSMSRPKFDSDVFCTKLGYESKLGDLFFNFGIDEVLFTRTRFEDV